MPRKNPHLVLLKTFLRLLACGLLSTTVGNAAFAKGSFTISPPQSWIQTVHFENTGVGQTAPSTSSSFLLDDHQFRVSEGNVDRYYHHVQRIDTTAGLEDLSQLRFYFEPSYQQLTIHFIRIVRNNEIVNALKPREIKVIHYEQELDQQLYNGTLAALVFLNDLRVGDIVEYGYTVRGENPVLGGRFAEKFYLADEQPIKRLTVRLVWPTRRPLSIKNSNTDIQPVVNVTGADTEYTWERHNTSSLVKEDATPEWYDPYPTVSLSEFATWGDVVNWALPLYSVSSEADSDLKSRVQRWQAELTSPAQRAVAALRFVQDEIRYLGIELGRYSHQPTRPSQVLKRRFGDCKDKSMLLTTLLSSMGIDALPALVNTRVGRSLDNLQPSPFAFDHVIVQARIDGRTYWLDPTFSYQRGALDQYYDLPYERALVLRNGNSELEKIPSPPLDSGAIVVNESYTTRFVGTPISLVVVTTYKGAEADGMRYQLATSSHEDWAKACLNFYANSNPSIRSDGPLDIKDDQVGNTLIVTEKYLIDDFWKDGKHYFLADKIYDEIGKPNVSQRSMPLRIRSPRLIKQTIEINLAQRYDVDSDHGSISDDALRFDYSFSREGNLIRLNYSLKTLADHVPVGKIQQHLVLRDKINNFVGFELTKGIGPTAIGWPSGATTIGTGVLAGVVVIALFIVLPIFLVRGLVRSRKRTQFADKLKKRSGYHPETPIEISDERTLKAFLSEFQCNCGGRPYNLEKPPYWDRFTYDGKRLIGIRLQCARCGVTTDLYFSLYSEISEMTVTGTDAAAIEQNSDDRSLEQSTKSVQI